MAAKISLIGLDQAEVGNIFRFVTPLQSCSECKIKNVCFNLEHGRLYKVLEVRKNQHDCMVFNHNKVATVQVEELDEEMVVEYGKRIQEGSTITLNSRHCDHITCQFIEKCNLIYQPDGVKVNIKKILSKLECPKGFNMRKIEVSYPGNKK
jgi:uncharacterized protein (UPF0179 family)